MCRAQGSLEASEISPVRADDYDDDASNGPYSAVSGLTLYPVTASALGGQRDNPPVRYRASVNTHIDEHCGLTLYRDATTTRNSEPIQLVIRNERAGS